MGVIVDGFAIYGAACAIWKIGAYCFGVNVQIDSAPEVGAQFDSNPPEAKLEEVKAKRQRKVKK